MSILSALVMPAQAVDWTWSGFGTIGFAQSDQAYKYQRFIDNHGTLKRDSILGAQLDARFSQQWSATVQGKVGAADHSDSNLEASLAWAFVSWRPSDDWLVRVGKIRLPLMLNTENNDVGATFDFARLPQEVYSISPLTDLVGMGVSKTWFGDSMDWIAEVYGGKVTTPWRYYGRELSPVHPYPGSWFLDYDIKSTGLVLTARSLDNTFRAGAHRVEVSRGGAKIGRPIVYNGVFYSFGSGGDEKLIIPLFTAGASVLLPAGVRMIGEYAWIKVGSSSEGLDRWGAYLSLSKRIGAWTPYVYYAKAKSRDSALEKYQVINSNPYGATQKFMADIIVPYDQSTVALGTTYRLTSSALLKAEWSQANTGVASSLVDAPSGGDSSYKHINVFSFSYNFTF
ncbi:MAG: hypothetical protein HGA71_03995 [Azonexaceae bacterium]|nr:hypothetical protein [Azonexaceae bacterium]